MSSENKMAFIDEIRGIAILLVVLVHVAQRINISSDVLNFFCRYGQTGVQLFFVASAYTLCASAENRAGESRGLLKYFLRRFFRIAPIYYIGIFFYCILSAFESYAKNKNFAISDQYSLENILVNIFFLHSFFPEANNNIVPGGWSIGVECAYYSIFPIFFQIFKKISSVGRYLFTIFSIAVCCCIVAFQVNEFNFDVINNGFLYYGLPVQLPVFLVGMNYFFDREKFERIGGIGFVFFVILFFISIFVFSEAENNNYLFLIVPLVASFSYVALINVMKLLKIRFNMLAAIGKVSYSMYLFHFIFAHKLTSIISKRLQKFECDYCVLIFLYVLSVSLSYIVAKISEKYIEKFFINFGANFIKKIN